MRAFPRYKIQSSITGSNESLQWSKSWQNTEPAFPHLLNTHGVTAETPLAPTGTATHLVAQSHRFPSMGLFPALHQAGHPSTTLQSFVFFSHEAKRSLALEPRGPEPENRPDTFHKTTAVFTEHLLCVLQALDTWCFGASSQHS